MSRLTCGCDPEVGVKCQGHGISHTRQLPSSPHACIDCKSLRAQLQEAQKTNVAVTFLNNQILELREQRAALTAQLQEAQRYKADADRSLALMQITLEQAQASAAAMREAVERTDELVHLITGSPPETQIKGEIESLAFEIGHMEAVLNTPHAGARLLAELKAESAVVDTITKDMLLRIRYGGANEPKWHAIADAVESALKDLAETLEAGEALGGGEDGG